MKVIKPVEFGEANLIASSVPETDYPAWNVATAYVTLDRVVLNHAIYEAAQDNTGKEPDAEPLYWTLISATNRWLMFDTEVNTQTVVDDLLQVTVAPGLINSMALLGLQGTNLVVVGTDGVGGPVIYNHSQALEGSIVGDWYQYFFEPFRPLTEVVLSDIPAYGSLRLEIDISAIGPVAVGATVFGTTYDIGRTLSDPTAGILDFSRKETSDTGTTRFQKRRYSRRMSHRLLIDNPMLERVYRLLSDLRATPCVWIGTDAPGYGFFTIFGFYRDFSIEVAYTNNSFCSLEIEGLT
jgi:hypothetical protein